jgi:CubicO group peptidase (beta-lactamase class C family)
MTIRQLLSHTAGVFDHLNSSTFWNDPNNYSTKVWHHDEIFQFAVDAGAYFPPGEGYAYSNTGFYILGAVAEKLLGEDLTDIFESWVFEPLGLENTFYDDFSMMGNTIDNLAESERAYDYHLSAAGAAGAIVSTPSDIAKFGKALYEGDFLSQDHIDAMLINIGAPLGGSDYGLGTRLWDDFGIYHYGHTGSLMDYRNIMMHVPDKSITIAIHANDVHENWFDLVNQVLLTTVNAF